MSKREHQTVDRNHAIEELEFVAFDLETTGLFPVACRIVEFGALRFRLDGPELGSFSQLVDPECDIPWEATRIHGITGAMVRGRPKVGEVLPRFIEFLGDSSTILLAHNAPFDLGFLSLAVGKLGLPVPPHRILDNLALARACAPGLASYRLESLAIRLRVADSEEHRALADCRLLMNVFRALLQRCGARTLEELLRLCPPCPFETAAAAPPAGFEELESAIQRRAVVVMSYEGGTMGAVSRTVTPLALLQSAGRYYLSAFCHADQIEKTYRLDRIRALRIVP